MKQRKPDRRVARTKRLLADTLIDLILEKGYDKVSVSTIVERADVGRTTFYAHFEDKDALTAFALGGIEQVVPISAELDHYLKELLSHATDEPRMFRAFLATHSLRQHLKQWLVTLFQTHWQVKDSAEAHFIAGGMIELLVWWQANQSHYSAEDILAIIGRQIARMK